MDDAQIDRFAGEPCLALQAADGDDRLTRFEVLLGYRLCLGQLRHPLEHFAYLIVTLVLATPWELPRLPQLDIWVEQGEERGEVTSAVRGIDALDELEIR